MQIVMNPENPQEEFTVLNKILKDFTIAHFINQNFVLYGDWDYLSYKDIFALNFIPGED